MSTISVDARAQQQLITSDTLGRPNAWDIAKNPKLVDDFAVHVTARRLLIEADDIMRPDAGVGNLRGSEGLKDTMLARARAMLTDAIKNGSTDPQLRFDLGEVLQQEKRSEAAADVLRDALTKFPAADGAHTAWLTYAFANSRLDQPQEERRGYEEFLASEPNPNRRDIPLLNLAEANMRDHRLSEAIAGYRDVENLSTAILGGPTTGVLAVWGLAIALDRQGDARGAAEQARIVSRMDPEIPLRLKRQILDSDDVYFVPSYEKFWYLALAQTEDAKQALTAEESVQKWGRTVVLWESYLEPAQTIEKPEAWNAVALRHLAAAENALKAAEIRLKAEPKTPKPADPLNIFYTRP